MKEYKNNEELLDYLISKNVTISHKEEALKNIEKYSYYAIVNGYKSLFKDENNNYKSNISAHSDRLFCYRNKYYISFKNIDKNYKRNGNFTNIYMIIECMRILLDDVKFKEFEKLFYTEVDNLKDKLHSINIKDILRIMGFNV